jgi:hypothetical protein
VAEAPSHRPHPEKPDQFDREIDLRALGTFAAALVVTVAFVFVLIQVVLSGFRARATRHDPPPSPLAEANARHLPPEPRLQPDPVRDMVTLRAVEDAALTTYGWVDRGAGVGRIPIARAMDLVLERGLPEPTGPTAPPATPPATTSPAPAGRRVRAR